jgi:hypothetical protein
MKRKEKKLLVLAYKAQEAVDALRDFILKQEDAKKKRKVK